MNNLFNNIRIVLIEPSHSGNVGSTARAMLNMGLKTYWLVNPKKGIDNEAIALSYHAIEVVKNATIVTSLADALEDIDYIVGTKCQSTQSIFAYRAYH